MRFARALPNDAPYSLREALGGKDARQLARELLGMSQAEFGAAFKGSPMKRAKLQGLKRNAAVVLGNIGDAVAQDHYWRRAFERRLTPPEARPARALEAARELPVAGRGER